MTEWSHFFHFAKDVTFRIDGPYGYDGRGKVLERTDRVLKLRLDLDSWGPAPALHATVTIEYVDEGGGNKALLEVDGQPPKADGNAKVYSDVVRRERKVSSSSVTFSVRNESSPNEVDFDVHLDGKSWDFDLERD